MGARTFSRQTFGRQDIWTTRHLDDKTFGRQDIWPTRHFTDKTFGRQDISPTWRTLNGKFQVQNNNMYKITITMSHPFVARFSQSCFILFFFCFVAILFEKKFRWNVLSICQSSVQSKKEESVIRKLVNANKVLIVKWTFICTMLLNKEKKILWLPRFLLFSPGI